MNKLSHIFVPNKKISKTTASTLIAGQIIICLLVWIYSPFVFLPTPAETLHSLHNLWERGFFYDMTASFTLNVEAILLSTVISLFLAYSTVIAFFRPLVEFICKLRFLSLVGLTFFFTLATRNGHELKLSLLVFSITVFFVTSMADVLNAIPKVALDHARTLRMGPWEIVWEVIILGQMDKVFDVVRQNAAISWLMLTMVEGISRAGGGVGTLLLDSNKYFRLSDVMAIQLTILIVGLAQDYFIGYLKEFFCPYALITVERK